MPFLLSQEITQNMASCNNRRVVTLQQLTKSGIAESLAEQALALYEKHYEVDAIGFDLATIREILYVFIVTPTK